MTEEKYKKMKWNEIEKILEEEFNLTEEPCDFCPICENENLDFEQDMGCEDREIGYCTKCDKQFIRYKTTLYGEWIEDK
tara:strand:- start:1835 stop:2071 length:237 start_codon:yes stop_codon:yes gene_type:complete